MTSQLPSETAEIVENAWNLFENNNLHEALAAVEPLKSKSLLAISICILIEMSIGSTQKCDELVLEADALGVRKYWEEQQDSKVEFGLLLARLDGMRNPNINISPRGLEFVELTKYLSQGFEAHLSFHKSIILIRRLWADNSADLYSFTRPFFLLLDSGTVDEETGDVFMANFLDALNWSLSRTEAKNVVGAMASMWESESE